VDYKYNFYTISREYSAKEYPEDINGIIEEKAKRLGCESLNNLLSDIRKKNPKPFGEIIVIDSNGVGVMSIEVHKGIIKKADINETYQSDIGLYKPKAPFIVQFKRSVQNDTTEFRRKELKNGGE
jgi:hypothetical protein